MAVVTITKENFEQEVLQRAKPVLLDFWASWCGPCRMLSPVVDEVAEERTDVKVGKVNVDEQPELAGEFGVMSIPTLLVFKGGKLVNQAVGARPKSGVLQLLYPFYGNGGINSKKSYTLLQMEPQNQNKRKTEDPVRPSAIWQSVCQRTWHE